MEKIQDAERVTEVERDWGERAEEEAEGEMENKAWGTMVVNTIWM